MNWGENSGSPLPWIFCSNKSSLLPFIDFYINIRSVSKIYFKKTQIRFEGIKNHKKLKFNLWKNQREKLVRENEIKTPLGQEIQQHYYLEAQNN